MPQPATPAQQRFLPGLSRRRSPSTRRLDKRSTIETSALPIDNALLRGDAQDQFNITPKFSAKSSTVKARTSAVLSRPPTTVTEATPSKSAADDVHDKTQSDAEEGDEMLLEAMRDEQSSWQDDLTLSPKRRRLSAADESTLHKPMSSARLFARPGQIAAKAKHLDASTGYRFRSTPSSQRQQAPAFAATTARPQDRALESPLPDAFSPHRRGDNYIPGGLASTLQQWVLETSQMARQARKTPQGVYIMQITVRQVLLDDDRLLLLEGVLQDEREVKVSLIHGASLAERTSKASSLSEGTVLGLREPCWPVTTSTDHWIVCVSWQIVT